VPAASDPKFPLPEYVPPLMLNEYEGVPPEALAEIIPLLLPQLALVNVGVIVSAGGEVIVTVCVMVLLHFAL
jgi:hypothetical protein